MDARYKYGNRPGRRRRTRVFIVFVVSLLIVGIVGGVIYADTRKNKTSETVEGKGRTIIQAADNSTNVVTLDDPLFSMEFPSDWKETGRINNTKETSITWQASKKNEDNRYMKIYIDKIPVDYPVNRMVPVSSVEAKLSVGEASTNCSTFTKGGLAAAGQAQFVKDDIARYQGINFMCSLSRITDNEVGTSSLEGVNTVTVTGPSKGKHKYFFLYTDRNIHPNDTIFYNSLRSFTAK